jgi:AraC family transcriptional activator of pobA
MLPKLPIKDKAEPGKSLKITAFRKEVRKTEAHKHNSYFEIIFLSKGEGLHSIDERTYPVTPPLIYVVRKEQVHFWDLKTEPDGFVIIIKKEFIDHCLDKEVKMLLGKVSKYNCIPLIESDAIEQLLFLLAYEYQSNIPDNHNLMEALIKALFAKILQMAEPTGPGNLMKAGLFERFQEILSEDQKIRNNVAYYAALLHTTPQNLNANCRKATGQAATEVLSSFIINEAKRLLVFTDMTALEISHVLDFKDNSHFVKYFKRCTGQTPKSFRSIS